jgi:hypothetical protein
MFKLARDDRKQAQFVDRINRWKQIVVDGYGARIV